MKLYKLKKKKEMNDLGDVLVVNQILEKKTKNILFLTFQK
jgi:hypothetical protein